MSSVKAQFSISKDVQESEYSVAVEVLNVMATGGHG